MDNNGFVLVRTRTIFFYLYKIVKLIKYGLWLTFGFNLLFINAYCLLRIYQSNNEYTIYLQRYSDELWFYFALFFLFYFVFLKKSHYRPALFFITAPTIFFITTYYISNAFEYTSTIPLIFFTIFGTTIIEVTFKKFAYRNKRMKYVGNPDLVLC